MKAVFSLEEDSVHSGISLQKGAFVVHYGFNTIQQLKVPAASSIKTAKTAQVFQIFNLYYVDLEPLICHVNHTVLESFYRNQPDHTVMYRFCNWIAARKRK